MSRNESREEHRCHAEHLPEACCVRAQPLLSETLSEGDRHRQKRANVQAGQLQQEDEHADGAAAGRGGAAHHIPLLLRADARQRLLR